MSAKMSSTGARKFCYCDVRVAALSVSVYKVIFTTACFILSAVGAYRYAEIPEELDETGTRIHRVIGGALIALSVFCFALLVLNVFLIWAVVKRKTSFIRWWIRLTVVIEVLIVSSMFMGKYWDTLRSFCLAVNFALNIFILKAICAYKNWLEEDTNGSLLKDEESRSHHTSQKRLSTESLHTSETPGPTTLLEEKEPEEVRH